MLDEHELDSDAGRKRTSHVCPHALHLTGDWVLGVLRGEQGHSNLAGSYEVGDPRVCCLLGIGDTWSYKQD
jgi:hypothetical protein